MKCYIKTKCINPRADVANMEWTADVVTEQDYHERGAHARSFRSSPHPSVSLAIESATEWARDNGYTVTSAEAVAA